MFALHSAIEAPARAFGVVISVRGRVPSRPPSKDISVKYDVVSPRPSFPSRRRLNSCGCLGRSDPYPDARGVSLKPNAVGVSPDDVGSKMQNAPVVSVFQQACVTALIGSTNGVQS